MSQVADVRGEAFGSEEPEDGSEDGAAPDNAPFLRAVGAVVIKDAGEGDGGAESDEVACAFAAQTPDVGEGVEGGVKAGDAEQGALGFIAEQDERGGGDQRDGGEKDQADGDAGLMEKGRVAGDAIGGVEALHEAFEESGSGPESDEEGDDEEGDGFLAARAELREDDAFGAGREHFFEDFGHGARDEFGAGH